MFVLLVLLALSPAGLSAQKRVGCLFGAKLCTSYEWCYDDYAFGRCIPLSGAEQGDLYRYDLEKTRSLHNLQKELERLYLMGYQWSHPYTQCVLQGILTAIRLQGQKFSKSECIEYEDINLDGALGALEGQQDNLEPKDLAYVSFKPSKNDPRGQYAAERYAPFFGDVTKDTQESEDELYYPDYSDDYETSYDTRYPVSKRERQYTQKRTQTIPSNKLSPWNNLGTEWSLSNNIPAYGNSPRGRWNNEQASWNESPRTYSDKTLTKVFPEQLQQTDDEQELLALLEEYLKEYTLMKVLEEKEENDMKKQKLMELLENVEQQDNDNEEEEAAPVFTEGGVQLLDDAVKNQQDYDDDYELGDYQGDIIPLNTRAEGDGFSRNERLDVKKPGPNFTGFFLRSMYDKLAGDPTEVEKEDKSVDETEFLHVSETPASSTELQPESEGMKEEVPSMQSSDSENTTDAQIKLHMDGNEAVSKEEAENIVGQLENYASLPDGIFRDVQNTDRDVSFKVDSKRGSASDIIKRIATRSHHEAFTSDQGRHILTADVGDEPMLGYPQHDDKRLFILTFTLCGAVAVVLLSAIGLYVYKRQSRSKDKLQKLAQTDDEPSKDYQDLCRARMASKNNDKQEAGTTGPRISSVSKESECSQNSPSSRSSTSSWCEEPVSSNMDISTGHMVLSYMEDHLKNKDRLEQEWQALCAYEAEPCSTSVAAKHQKKNRFPQILPFDHSRVILNKGANISSSDYINASTITDHDPRNPAYILTQGPLSSTTADFWQLVWEQGSVVIVMLTKLSESGLSLCHRYWPEEGADLYHIYEVHLVSEHIWCEDYLVRSFYLKNVKTGETRTVTQFHFLSWPDQGIPSSIKALLEFRRKVNKSYRGRSCPIIVHCSDGVGRSGTYCLIDMVLNRMAKGAKEIDIAATLEHIRDQRAGAVATRGQFEFTLMAVAEEVHAILKALPQ